MRYVISVFATALLLTSCATYVPYESGRFWCGTQIWKKSDFDDKHRAVAKRGYIYALAGALALQQQGPEDDSHHFVPPNRLVEIKPRPPRESSGFEVALFELHSVTKPEVIQEVIIAFAGSNDTADWVWTNFLFDKAQYDLARKYVLSIAENPKYSGKRISTVGYSLGGALAVHTKKSPATSRYISEAWAFNSSPKIYASGRIDENIWMASVRGEALSKLRWPVFRVLPGVSRIGAPEAQRAEDYYLISANAAYSHFRWVLRKL